jgi:ribonuclease HI
MPKRRKKKLLRVLHQSTGPLPLRLADRFAGQLLIFCDASKKRHGGLAAVLFAGDEQPPVTASQTVPAIGSNELELQAALFALLQAARHFPGRPFTLFTDNTDTAIRLSRVQVLGLAHDPDLVAMLPELDLAEGLAHASIHWLKGHSSCRGNTLADELAGAAAH